MLVIVAGAPGFLSAVSLAVLPDSVSSDSFEFDDGPAVFGSTPFRVGAAAAVSFVAGRLLVALNFLPPNFCFQILWEATAWRSRESALFPNVLLSLGHRLVHQFRVVSGPMASFSG